MLGRYGESAVIAFSGAEDVALIDMAAKSGKRFSVMTLDTGRLHPETYRFIDKVRAHYGIEIRALFPTRWASSRWFARKASSASTRTGTASAAGSARWSRYVAPEGLPRLAHGAAP